MWTLFRRWEPAAGEEPGAWSIEQRAEPRRHLERMGSGGRSRASERATCWANSERARARGRRRRQQLPAGLRINFGPAALCGQIQGRRAAPVEGGFIDPRGARWRRRQPSAGATVGRLPRATLLNRGAPSSLCLLGRLLAWPQPSERLAASQPARSRGRVALHQNQV